MSTEFSQRKPTRLKGFDYNTNGAYFITVCTEDRRQILSRVVPPSSVGEGLAPPKIELYPCGKIAEAQLLLLEKRYHTVSIDKFVIMPDHIHMILILQNDAGGASPSPTVSDIICSFKSITSRICKAKYGIEHIFQRSFYDHIIRDKDDYETRVNYISENPQRWYYDKLNSIE